MGISGLLQGLKSTATRKGNIREFGNQAVAVDASSWLHKSVYSICDHYVECMERSNSLPDKRCVDSSADYMIRRCDELLRFAQLKRIYLVMDGARCPLKSATNQERERTRVQNLEQARRYRQAGQRDKMFEKYKACIKVRASLGHAVAARIGKRFKSDQVTIVWAPYEADAQMLQLCVEKKTRTVITEDSDVLVYAATCRVPVPIIFKLDKNSGNCDITSMEWLLQPDQSKWTANATKKKSSGLDAFLQAFAIREKRTPGLGVRLFVQSCVLAGCDYALNVIEGVGTVTAFKHVRNSLHRADRFEYILKRVLSSGQRDSLDVKEHEILLSQSEAVFYYHPVLNVGARRVSYLNDPHAATDQMPSLERFGEDWTSFLGVLTAESSVGLPPCAKPKIPSFFAAPKPSSHSVEAKNTYTRKDRPTTVVDNPYKQASRKRTRPALQQKSPNEPPPADNPFAKFGFSRKDPPSKKPKNLLDTFAAKEDVRFVKRSFPKDGSRQVLKNPPAVPKSRVSRSDSQEDPMSSASEALPAAVIPQRAPEVIDVDLETEPAATDEIAQPTNTSDMNDVSEAESPRCKSATIIARRVTLDPTEDTVQADDESDSHCSSPFTVDPKQNSFPAVCDRNDAPAAAQFDLYDDFMSPKKNDDDSNACLSDEIVDSSPEVCIVDPPARVRRPPQASFGPAKTLRFRFGPPPAAGRPSQASKSGRSSTTAKPIARPLTMLRMSTSPRNMQTKLHSHYFSRKK